METAPNSNFIKLVVALVNPHPGHSKPKYFPNDIIFGNLEPAIIQTGTSEDVYDESKKVIEKGKKLPGGFIFAPGCELPPRAPIDNVMAMSKAIHDFGWYC